MLTTLLQRLEQALDQEADALRAHDAAALLTAIAGKREILRSLNTTVAKAGRNALSSEIVAALKRCKERNDASGGAIAMLLQDTRSALGVLGIAAETPEYGARGTSARRLGNRALAVC